MNVVVQKIEKIKSVFLDTQQFYSTNNNISELVAYLDKTDNEFRSIAYESASMCIALKDLENSTELVSWLLFSNGPALAHKAQVYIGLGWAVAKLGIPFLPVAQKVDSQLYYRIADGCGYYDGSFRHRHTVLSQQLPQNVTERALPFYDQGVGRSLWYSCQADINKVRSKIESFTPSRRADLWRGMGIAVAYVGGCDENTLKILFGYAGADGIQLACGAALAARSRMKANTMTSDTDQCSRLWYSLIAMAPNIYSVYKCGVVDVEDEAAYLSWIIQNEERLANSFEKREL